MTSPAGAPASPPQDERIVAALAHATIILPLWGVLGAIVIWATQKDKSRYVAFQSLQAVAYHFVVVVGGFVAGACYMCSAFALPLLMMATASADPSGEVSPAILLPMMGPFAILGGSILGWFLIVVYGLAGAAAALQGRDFRYLWIGRRLEAYLAHP